MLQIVAVMLVAGNLAFLPLGMCLDKSQKFSIAHGGQVYTKGLYLIGPRVRGINGTDGCRRHRHGFTRTELTLGLQLGYLREWLRHRILTGLRCLPRLALRIFETLLFFFTPLRCGPLLCFGSLSLSLKLLLGCQLLLRF